MLQKMLQTTLGAIASIPEYLRGVKTTSLVEYTQPTRCEPIVMVDSDAVYYSGINDIMQSAMMIFAGYYLQSVSLLTNLDGVNVSRMLEKLNPSRNPADNAAFFIGNVLLSEESYKYSFPNPRQLEIAIEKDAFNDELEKQGLTLARNTTQTAASVSNLCVGMLLEFQVENNGTKVAMVASIRLLAHSIQSDNLVHNLSYASTANESAKERYYAWRAGTKETIGDMIFCNDLVDAHRKALLDDKSGALKEIMARANGNKMSAILSGQPSIATASNIAILTRNTAIALQAKVGGSLDTVAIRDKIFKTTQLMLMFVIDERYDQVVIYHRGISTPTTLSIRDMKTAGKSNGVDVTEILKSFQLGVPPTF